MFGEMVRFQRRRLGITQMELAREAAVSVRTIRAIESGRIRRPRTATVRLLANAFGLRDSARDRFLQGADGAPEAEGPENAHILRHGVPVPAQLPPDVTGFIGRDDHVRQLTELLDRGHGPTSVVISAIAGTAGVGKTALAVHWAHQVRNRFPDGQLYVNLRGYDPDQQVDPGDALAGFLAGLGVDAPDVPLDVSERAARYRSETADRRMLIVLDNAAGVEQVRPLLPGGGYCRVIVTSRDALAGLVAVQGAHRLDLDVLPIEDAVTLLRLLIGPRAEADPQAAATLAEQCARLPLALRVAAELAVSRPESPLIDLVTEFADQQQRLELLDAGGDPRAAMAAVFSWSIRHLPPEAAKGFALLGLHPGPDCDAHAVAALAGTTAQRARRILDLLGRAHLVHPTAHGRYGMHDLLRAYAVSLATAENSPDAGQAPALGRLFDYYLATAAAAMDTLYPAEAHRRPRIAPPTTPLPELADVKAARAWLDTERHCLAAVAALTATSGWAGHAVRLSATLFRYLDAGHYMDALTIHEHARHAADQIGDRAGKAGALLGLGGATVRMNRYELAAVYFEESLALFRQAGDTAGQARALNNLGTVDDMLGRNMAAIRRYERVVELFRLEHDWTGEAYALTNLGVVEERVGHHEEAAGHHRRALALHRELGNRDGEAHALTSLGIVEARLGRYERAADHHRQGLALNRQLGNGASEAATLDDLGRVCTLLGRPEEATEHHQQALTLYRRFGNRDGQAWALNGLADAAHASGDFADALAHRTAALALAADVGNRAQQAAAHAGLGHTYQALGDLGRADDHYTHALTLYTDLSSSDADEVRARLAALRRARASSRSGRSA